jgi:quercetin dioxygenase-like cupin family protein
MIASSLLKNLQYQKDKPAISVLLETGSTKEIRIAMRGGHTMKEHQTPFPIVVEIFEGAVDFGVKGKLYPLKKGDIVALEASVPHDLNAKEDSIVRLTLSKSDTVQRVKKVVE